MYRRSEKKLVKSSNTSFTCPHNMADFSQLTAEISWWVWGTPANFNGLCILAWLFLWFDQQHSTYGDTYIQLGGHHCPHSSPRFSIYCDWWWPACLCLNDRKWDCKELCTELLIWLGLASIRFWSRSDRLLYSVITIDQRQDWSRSWT